MRLTSGSAGTFFSFRPLLPVTIAALLYRLRAIHSIRCYVTMCIMVAIKDVHLCTPKKAPDKQEYIAKASTCGLIA
jgi:hypothetical protein